jgi:hypothetical protein
MAGNPKTPKSVAPKTAQMKPGSKGVMVGLNKGKGVVQSSATKLKSTMYRKSK